MISEFTKQYPGETEQKYISIMYQYLESIGVTADRVTPTQRNKIVARVTADFQSIEERSFIIELLDKYIDFAQGNRVTDEQPARIRLFYELYGNKYKKFKDCT